MRRWPIVALLLLAAPLAAQDESLPPDGNSSTSGWGLSSDACATRCNTAACHDEIDEGIGASDNLFVGMPSNNTLIRYTFPTPSATPSTAASAQSFRVVHTKCTTGCAEDTGGSDPTYTIALVCAGVTKATLASGVSITAADDDDTHAFTYTPDGDCDAAGANVEAAITGAFVGGGASRRTPCTDILVWQVTHASAAARRVIVVNGGQP